MQAKEIMTTDPACCTPDTPLPDVARLMVEHDCGEIPVIEGRDSRKVVGVVTDRDITCRVVAQNKNPGERHAADCMSAPAVTVSAGASVEDCCRAMEEHQIRRVPVVDARGEVAGIVSQADIARAADADDIADVVRQVSQPTSTPSRAGGACC